MSAVEAAAGEARVASPVALTLIDEQHPWLGLDSFSEETRQFFHGREEEIAELARRVQRKTLTVLFGQSGLGKTSILRAGIVPRLRREGFCPVYVRLDYAPESPPPSEQIKRAIFRATETSGTWSKPGSATAGESLWEFLHHRDDVLRDAEGRALTPLLIFDQFEEIFTLAQDDDFGRQRAAQFVADLADLVENRLPKPLEAQLETDDDLIDRFDFERTDYRLLVALREDYLANLEAFKGAMPSITQNRMRLARMTGAQALTAVMKPGGRLVSQEVAEAIVRFVAGGAELRNAEVEPALLSLVCRELNNARVAQGRAEISADVLAGSHESILAEFYERALAGQPAGVRAFIEDEMLTESGFRESLAEERVQRAFASAGAATGTLAGLVNRRLLRIEERLDVRRVELTHDVLCPVVRASRDQRHEREARDAARRELAAQKERELAARRALARARKVAAGASVLALVAVAGAVFGYVNLQRSHEAEARALQARSEAQSARAQAEKLIVYLLDDFYVELEPVGRLDIVARLAKRTIDYYGAVPLQARDAESERTRALALVRYGYAQRYLNQIDEARKALDEAVALLKDLRAKGDTSEVAAIGLALGISARGRVEDSMSRFDLGAALAMEAVQLLDPLVSRPEPSMPLRRAFAQAATYGGFTQLRIGQEAAAVQLLERSRAMWRSIDDLQLGDLAAAVGFAEASSWKVDGLSAMGRSAEAWTDGEEGRRVAAAVLEKRPGHMGALRSHGLLSSALAALALRELDPKRAYALSEASVRDWTELLKLDPGNAVSQANLTVGISGTLWSLWDQGRGREAVERLRQAMATIPFDEHTSKGVLGNAAEGGGVGAVWAAEIGDGKTSAEMLAAMRRAGEYYVKGLSPEGFSVRLGTELRARFESLQAEAAGDYGRMREIAQASLERLAKATASNDGQRRRIADLTASAHYAVARAAFQAGDDRAAEAAGREAVRLRSAVPARNSDEEGSEADARVLLAAALGRQGRAAEASEALAPALAFHRRITAKGNDSMLERLALAQCLHAAALAHPDKARAHLAEAQRQLDSLPAEMQARRSVTVVRHWIAQDKTGRRARG